MIAASRYFQVLVTVIAAVALPVFLFAFAGDFLDVNQPPVHAGAIIVLGGGPMDRIMKGIELYSEGYAPLLVLSGGNLFTQDFTEAQAMARVAENVGRISPRHILLESKSTTTYQNALFTKPILLAHRITSALVVSSDYHMRRVQLIFSRVYRGTGIRLTYCAAPDPYFHPDDWWANRRSVFITLSEYLKIAAALIGIE